MRCAGPVNDTQNAFALTSLLIIPSCSCSCNVLVVSGDGLEPGANTLILHVLLVLQYWSLLPGWRQQRGASVPACPAVPHSGLSRLHRGTSHISLRSQSAGPTRTTRPKPLIHGVIRTTAYTRYRQADLYSYTIRLQFNICISARRLIALPARYEPAGPRRDRHQIVTCRKSAQRPRALQGDSNQAPSCVNDAQ